MQDHGKFEGMNRSLWVWYCHSCRAFHIRTNQVILTFTHEEYAAFTRAVVGCYCQYLPLLEEEEETLASVAAH